MKTRALYCGVGLIGLLLAGCYESPQATLYEPGEYKGSPDPFLEKQATPAQQETLRERFSLVQEDR